VPTAGADAPAEVDFNSLWHEVHRPVLEKLGFRAVRADGELGALMVVEMIHRLALADVVVADVSLASSNVYYEVGVRHAAHRNGCVLIAASWAQPVFDLAQIRRVEYPLADGTCGSASVAAAQAALLAQLPPVMHGISPIFEAMPGYPNSVEAARRSAFADVVDELSSFERDVSAIRLTTDARLRAQKTRDLAAKHGERQVVRESVVVELIGLIRDNLDWSDVLEYIDGLPPQLRRYPPVAEQRQLALAKTGEVEASAAALEQLIALSGATSERLGLLGGRYKQLMRAASDPAAKRRLLGKAIAAYERGMALDLNDYYPASNLPRLYRLRAGTDDERRAKDAATVATVACQASLTRNPDDPWARPTLLGAAFDTGDLARASELIETIRDEGTIRWNLETTIDDLADSLRLHTDASVRAGLERLFATLREMLSE
jgi:hypothetical protein